MKFLKILQQILSGKFLTSSGMRRYYPLLLFIAALALIWITITYSAMQTRREIGEVESKLKIAEVDLKKQKNIYTKNSRPSQLLERLKDTKDSVEIKMAHGNTYKIIVKKDEGGNYE